MENNTKKLIINADDFGISQSANQAILSCFQKRVLDSTTLMVNMPFAKEAALISKQYELPVGLHFNLTLGKPVSPINKVSSLVDDRGNFYKRRNFIKKYFTKRIKHEEIQIEFKAQLQLFKEFGLDLDHIDSHQHIHVLPKIFDLLAHYCQTNNTAVRMVKEAFSSKQVFKKRIKAKVLSLLVKRNNNKWHGKIKTNDYLMSIFDVMTADQQLTVGLYETLFKNLPNGVTELMIHPSLISQNDAERKLTRISHISEQEYQILTSSQFKQLLKKYTHNRVLFSSI